MAVKTKSTGIDKITKSINTHCITYSENNVNHKEKKLKKLKSKRLVSRKTL